ncbi:MAG TPA: aminotransferase class III-fold pyridoxal phosphate-dependent enzyme [Oleiagrimonas sp.]|nr:aminotransferase class III-fold pyridoxal phosphate-dependent enzyme [Oleiagrimonas sp.]
MTDFATPAGGTGHPVPERGNSEILDLRRRHLNPALSVSYREPLKIVRGEGVWLYDAHGQRYLDMVNNVCHVGHCHPRVVAAGQAQMARLNTNTRYLHDNIVDYAMRLTATLPERLSVVYLTNSGTEANDLALRLARAHAGGARGALVVDHAYHGHSPSMVELSPYKFDGPGGAGRSPRVGVVPMPDTYRGRHRNLDTAGSDYAAYLAPAIDSLHENGADPAAFYCESMLGCGGQIVLPEGYLHEAYATARAAGAVCVADEVQVGFGRVGSHFWAFQEQGVVPDIVTLGKPIADGHPMGGVVTTPEVAASFANGMEYFNTFGGNPVSCAIALAVLDVIEDEKLQDNALRVGRFLMDGLHALEEQHACIGNVRGRGLFIGVELVSDRASRTPDARKAAAVVEAMKARHVLLSTDGPAHDVLKIKPPIVFSLAHAEQFLDKLDEVLDELT